MEMQSDIASPNFQNENQHQKRLAMTAAVNRRNPGRDPGRLLTDLEMEGIEELHRVQREERRHRRLNPRG